MLEDLIYFRPLQEEACRLVHPMILTVNKTKVIMSAARYNVTFRKSSETMPAAMGYRIRKSVRT